MSLSLYSENHYVGPLASIGGYHDLVQQFNDDTRPIGQFLADGYTADPQQLRTAIHEYMAADEDGSVSADVLRTLSNLGDLLADVHLVAIVHDTIYDDQETDSAAPADTDTDALARTPGAASPTPGSRFVWNSFKTNADGDLEVTG
jgi:predicted metal-dependent HD superfamily phosphohydrolase